MRTLKAKVFALGFGFALAAKWIAEIEDPVSRQCLRVSIACAFLSTLLCTVAIVGLLVERLVHG